MSRVIKNLLKIDPYWVHNYTWAGGWYDRTGRIADQRALLRRATEIFPDAWQILSVPYFSPLPEHGNAQKIAAFRNLIKFDPTISLFYAWLAASLLDAGLTEEVGSLIESARQLDSDHFLVKSLDMLYLTYQGETSEALEIAEILAQPESPQRSGSKDMALRTLAARALATDGGAGLIPLYLSAYPGLAAADLTRVVLLTFQYRKSGHLSAALDLAVLYERAGRSEKAESLLAAVEAELPYWPRRGVWGIGVADAELHAIRGDDAAALAALRRAAEDGWTQLWWWYLDHSPHFERLRGTPEFSEIGADFAARAAVPATEIE